jgi:hypothetical protein
LHVEVRVAARRSVETWPIQYGLNHSLTGVRLAPAKAVINNAQLGTAPQTLNPNGSVFTGATRHV